MRIVFVSVDPHRDTPDILQAYVDAFNKNAMGVTGDESRSPTWRAPRRLPDRKPKPGDDAEIYDVTHSRGVYIFDNKGRAAAGLGNRQHRGAHPRHPPAHRHDVIDPSASIAMQHVAGAPRIRVLHPMNAAREYDRDASQPFPYARSTRMSIIIMIIVGFIVGLIARAVMPGTSPWHRHDDHPGHRRRWSPASSAVSSAGTTTASRQAGSPRWWAPSSCSSWSASSPRNAPDAAPCPASSGAKTGRPLAGRPVAFAAQPPAGPRISRRRLAPVAPRPPPRRCARSSRRPAPCTGSPGWTGARRVSTSDCWALYSERCESSTLR